MENWSKGKAGGTVITDTPDGFPENSGHIGTDAHKYYGGALVCESIWRKKDVALISAAPDLLEALKNITNDYIKLATDGPYTNERLRLIKEAQKAILKAETL